MNQNPCQNTACLMLNSAAVSQHKLPGDRGERVGASSAAVPAAPQYRQCPQLQAPETVANAVDATERRDSHQEERVTQLVRAGSEATSRRPFSYLGDYGDAAPVQSALSRTCRRGSVYVRWSAAWVTSITAKVPLQ